ncbi:MAG: DNA polymerase III subunit gamma/tau [Polyangiaceae bacterium]|nr:DNA polymerase III subunit gamma/tau [Polyangiaceae bacterium]
MSYVVLARKWRPMTFEDLVGQEHVATTLANAIAIDRVAHAFLFTGVRGVGKTTSARILAKALNCEKGPTAKPCLQCSACIEIAAGQDMDVQEIDAASRTGVDDIRDLQEKLVYRPARDRFKIFIVDEVHMLSQNAWNAFLKTLEEPPPHVKFIFATTEVNKVPVTILSRCQRYDFKLIGASTIASRLDVVLEKEGIKAEPAAVQLLAREAAGSMRDAMSLLDQVIAWAGQDGGLTASGVARALGVAESSALYKVARAVVSQQAGKALELSAELADAGFDIGHVTRDFLALLRDLVAARVAPDTRTLLSVPDSELAELKDISHSTTADDLSRIYLGFSKSAEEILESPLPRASFEMAIVRAATRPPLVPVDELVRRLVDLEARLDSGARASQAGAAAQQRPQAAPPAPAPREARGADDRPRPRPSEPSDDPEPPAPSSPPPPLDDEYEEALPPYDSSPPPPTAPSPTAPSPAVQAAPAFAAPAPAFSAPAFPAPAFGRSDAPVFKPPPMPVFKQPEPPAFKPPEFKPPELKAPEPPAFKAPEFTFRKSAPAPPSERPTNGSSQPFRPPEPPVFKVPDSAAFKPPASVSQGPPGSEAPPFRVPELPAPPPNRYTAISDPGHAGFAILADFADAARTRSGRLASILERAALIEASDTRLVLGYEPRSFEANLLAEPQAKALLASLAGSTLGHGATVDIVDHVLAAETPTLAKMVSDAVRARREEIDRGIRNHPLVAACVNDLGAEIRDVRLPRDAESLAMTLQEARERAQ